MAMMQDQEQKMEIFESEDFQNQDEEEKDDIAHSLKPNATSDLVIEENIKPSIAFQVFAGKIYDPTQPIEPINKDRRQYETTYKTIDKNINTRFESPLERYKRLREEISSFQSELDDLVKKVKDDSSDPTKEISSKLNNDISLLWKDIENFQNNPKLAPFFDEASSGLLETVDADYLLKKLEQFQSKQQENDSKNDQENTNDPKSKKNVAVFSLYHDGNLNSNSYQMKEITDRITKLEKIIGPSPENPKANNMNKTIEYLSKRLEFLSDDTKLSSLGRRAQTLKKELTQYSTKSHQQNEMQVTKTKENMINKMFEMMQRWDESASNLPTVIQRLRSLKNVHQEAANTVGKVDELGTQSKLIKQTLASNQETLKQVQKSLAENAQLMKNNVESIEKRIKDLQEKMQKL